jgi:hypothetical protein
MLGGSVALVLAGGASIISTVRERSPRGGGRAFPRWRAPGA